MKIILLQTVAKIGKKDEIVEVPEGYARNALLPKGLAIAATPQVIKNHEIKLSARAENKILQQKLLEDTYLDLSREPIVLQVMHTAEGGLFKKIHEKDVVVHIEKTLHKNISAEDISSSIFPLKHTGEYKLSSKAFPKISLTLHIE